MRETGPCAEFLVQRELFNIHDVQPLGEDILLVCARSHMRGPQNPERNGRVYRRDGTLRNELLLGDGIASVQTTSESLIWVAYFDEGIFGNFGWNDPLGRSGLVAWDPIGAAIYEYAPPPGLDTMCDCYALNVTLDGDVWCCYYTDFPLVRVRDSKVIQVWDAPVAGTHAFAIDGSYALFRGGYQRSDTYVLCRLTSRKKPDVVAEFTLTDEEDQPLAPGRVVGRGASLYLLQGHCVYRLDVGAAFASK